MEVKDVLESNDISYRIQGNDYLVSCLNPEHDDSNPSMRIDRISGVFNCFACTFKGNIFVHFKEDANILQIKRNLLNKTIDRKRSESIGLKMPPDAVPYEGNWREIDPETYKKFNAFQSASSDYIGRIVFPVYNITGKIVAFIGRHTTGGSPKYLVRPHKAKIPLFPIVESIRSSVILVEGIYDAINLHDKGLTNAIACFGVNTVTKEKLELLKVQGVKEIILFFDGDKAGQDGAAKVEKLCDRVELLHRNVFISNSDPGELTRKQVSNLYRKLYK